MSNSYSPFYEMDGPNIEYVKNDILKLINNDSFYANSKTIINCTDILFKKIIEKSINEAFVDVESKDFGSWRGYVTFGVKNIYKKKVNEIFTKKISALQTIKKRFIPVVLKKIYKPGGNMYNKIKNTTLVGNNNS